jgi:hypothetical protein
MTIQKKGALMMRNLILAGLVALGAAGCGGDGNNNNTNPDMATAPQGGDMAENPDLAPNCVTTAPASDSDFLNACTTVDSVEISPFYPANAPGGVLPPLQ